MLTLILVLFAISGCIEQSPPPDPQPVPTAVAGELIFIGIESSLTALELILSSAELNQEPADQLVFVSGARDDLLAQVEAGELNGAFVYQKPAAAMLWSLPIALDSLTIITHPNVGVAGLNRPQLQQLFTAGLKDWSAVGGTPNSTQIVVLDTQSGLHDLLNDRILENRSLAAEAFVAPNPTEMQTYVAQTEGAIGYLPTSLFDPAAGVQPLSVDGFLPQSNTVQSQQYPLTVPIYIATAAEPQGELRQLIGWLQSAEGQQELARKFVLLPE